MLKQRELFPTVNSLERRFPIYVKELRRGFKLEIFHDKEGKGSQVNEMENESPASLNTQCHFVWVSCEIYKIWYPLTVPILNASMEKTCEIPSGRVF